MINTLVLMGRLTAEPALRVSEGSGREVCGFTIANQRVQTDADGNRVTDFFDVVAWDRTAKFVTDHFHKGDCIVVAGSLRTHIYEGRDGKRRLATEIHAREVGFGERKRESV